jgi:protein involved in polysaccharide export with SLBB domain
MKSAERRGRGAVIHVVCRVGYKSAIVFLTIMLWACTYADSQTQRSTKKPEDFEIPLEEEKAALPNFVQQTGVALESTVNPEEYFVGPSDIIAVNIWMSPPLSLPLTVTPEGTLIIPSVGEVMVANLTLARAKEKIITTVRKQYLRADITATLAKPRQIIISVAGRVFHPGLYTLSGADRVNKAVEEANKLSRLESQDDLQPILEGMSTRHIVLRHRDGTEEPVDIPKYFATHQNRWNPYLREGDVVVVPKKERITGVFAVYGQVNTPGRYEYVDGDSVLDAIKIAHGLTHLAIAEKTILSRMNPDGKTLSEQIIDLAAMMSGASANLALEPGDRIIVQRRAEARGDYNVDISGEVVNPGTYPITRNNTHISEVIRQAGGFTSQAALNSAQISRQPPDPWNVEYERMSSLRGEPLGNDSAGYAIETAVRVSRAPVTVDFEKLFMQHDSTQDIVLQAEDQIVIPSRAKTVYVFGQVAQPGHVPFMSGKDVKYYVSKAGGYTDRANGGSLRIIKAKTKQWLEPGATTVEEGDYVWVPAEPDRPFSYYMTVASQSAAVLSVIIGIAFIIQQTNK